MNALCPRVVMMLQEEDRCSTIWGGLVRNRLPEDLHIIPTVMSAVMGRMATNGKFNGIIDMTASYGIFTKPFSDLSFKQAPLSHAPHSLMHLLLLSIFLCHILSSHVLSGKHLSLIHIPIPCTFLISCNFFSHSHISLLHLLRSYTSLL